ncbi:hypothetical protein M0805_003947 [Coniferiporia weirii]|nr:hypothetical protein M0805_003947 [Coniferiporia weirii]
MKFPAPLAAIILASVRDVVGTPVARAANSSGPYTTVMTSPTNTTSFNDTQILQYALTLEHLESAFYQQGLAQYSDSDFTDAGLPSWVRGRFAQIGQHEMTHVQTLNASLGNDTVGACNYSFPYTDPYSFAALSLLLESVGNSAYLGGGTSLTTNASVLSVASSILSVEARHSSWIQSSVFDGEPWSGAFDTAIDPKMGYSLASTFITSCPSSNPSLALTAFPSLSLTNPSGGNVSFNGSSTPAPGTNVTLVYSTSNTTSNGTQYAAFLNGLNTTFVAIGNNQTTIPPFLQGFVYTFVTTSNTSLNDSNIVAGPAPFTITFDDTASNP